jgi:hypothetical protein
MKNLILMFISLLLVSTKTLAVDQSAPSTALNQRTQQSVPYNVEQTVQTFTKTVHGGVQHVVVKIAEQNDAQIKLIQAHLLKTVEQFQKGDFSITERIHGKEMPGLAALKQAKTDDIKYEYKALSNGGQIHFSSEYPQYVQALHEWFTAQSQEHGGNTTFEHSQHHATTQE